MSGWDKKSDLLDPMCGTGTILIEAAMIARNIAPNLLFLRLKNGKIGMKIFLN